MGARHKAGIFQAKRPALTAVLNMKPSVQSAIDACAKEVDASPVRWIEPARRVELRVSSQLLQVEGLSCDIDVPLNGDFQRSNTALAVALLTELRSQCVPLRSREGTIDDALLSDTAISAGISQTCWPGRLQWADVHGSGSVLLDGAHNVAAASALSAYVNESVRKDGVRVAWIVAMSAGKDSKGLLQELLRDQDVFIAVPFSDVQGMPWVKHQDPSSLVDTARSVCPNLHFSAAETDIQSALEKVQAQFSTAKVVVCGSLYLVADVTRLTGKCKA